MLLDLGEPIVAQVRFGEMVREVLGGLDDRMVERVDRFELVVGEIRPRVEGIDPAAEAFEPFQDAIDVQVDAFQGG